MGVKDRDWYWKDRDEKERAAATTPTAKASPRQPRDPDELIRKVNNDQGPKLWGSNWHWSIQLLVWLCIAVLSLLAWRLVR